MKHLLKAGLQKSMFLAVATCALICSGLSVPHAQTTADDGTITPVVEVRHDDYADARKHFHTKLLTRSGPPQTDPIPVAPAGVTAITFPSGKLKLIAWINLPVDRKQKYPAVLFLHGGFGFGVEDWEMTKPLRDAGYVVLAPMLRGENDQPGNFTLFYDEVEDVLAAGKYLRSQPFVDRDRVFVAGHSIGGTMAMLASMTSHDFRGAASFSGSPDQIIFVKYGFPLAKIPFDRTDPRELQMRSPLAFAGSFKCPARIFFGTREPHFRLSSQRTAEIAHGKGLNVVAVEVEGSHFTAVPEEMKQAVAFFAELARGKH
jgi:dipeptidyl aminopeptidase/acylaminoacyl peptidase